jgi:hypothetical protein
MDSNIISAIESKALLLYSNYYKYFNLRQYIKSIEYTLSNIDKMNLNILHTICINKLNSKQLELRKEYFPFLINSQRLITEIFKEFPNYNKEDVKQYLEIQEYLEKTLEGLSTKNYINTDYLESEIKINKPYIKPIKSDMAIILVYFNPCQYERLKFNIKTVYNSLMRSDIPVFIVEHCFKDQPPLFEANGQTIFTVRSQSCMFYKENLINWIVSSGKIPLQYTKYTIMDADLIFENINWYNDISILLDTNDIIQPFKYAAYLESDLKSILRNVQGILSDKVTGKHCGFAWSVRRNFFEKVKMFDLAIFGSGDVCWSNIITGNKANRYNIINWMQSKYNDYFLKGQSSEFCASFYDQTIYHLWHGDYQNRIYCERHAIFSELSNKYNIKSDEDLLEINADGIYEFKEPFRDIFNEHILLYFKIRNDDNR